MAKEITDEYREELHEAFLMFDKNRDGSISVQELSQILQNLNQGATMDEINEMIKQVDVDGDGEIGMATLSLHSPASDFEEFVQMMANAKCSTEEEMKQAFDVFDSDGNGYIDRSELRDVLKQLGEEVLIVTDFF
jgi:Ca2+-binding EF-hand superfamily protein